MKLLKLEIGEMPKEKQFRSLHSGFKIEFHSLDNKGLKSMESFSPFCFAGLNGSGKSNVLEALSAIFFHLECCVAKFKPQLFASNFRPHECSPDAFTLEYLIWRKGEKDFLTEKFYKVVIKKEIGKPPRLFRQLYPFTDSEEIIEESINPPKQKRNQEPEPAPAKMYLPDIVVGYSSGENEILSLPFRKSRLINFDKYRQDSIDNRPFEEPENSLIYIDAEMSQAVLLACLLFEDVETLEPLRNELGIVGLHSFRMNINNYELHKRKDSDETVKVVNHCKAIVEQLKLCATCWNEFDLNVQYDDGTHASQLTLDFFVTEETKKVFKQHFKSSFDLFRFFQMLYELNMLSVDDYDKEDTYKSKGVYTDWKIPESKPKSEIFTFLNYLILKDIEGETVPKPLLLREFSDGEHQFLHTMGICLMLKDRKSLLLLDEPETHFNPSWRAKFIKILGDSIETGNNQRNTESGFNLHYMKDVFLTSHSPFIISDCMPDNVIFFKRNDDTKLLEAKKASEMGLNTYGSSVDYILKNFFKTNLISNKSFEELKDIIDNGTIDELRRAVEDFGESSEKQFLFKKIYEKMEKKDDN